MRSVRYRILKSYKDTPHGRSGIIGFHEITNNKNGIWVFGNQYFQHNIIVSISAAQ